MLRGITVAALAVAAFSWLALEAAADDPDADDDAPRIAQDDAEVYIEAPGARVALDRDTGQVEIRAGNARIYADDSWVVDIQAPGLTIRAQRP